MRSLKKQGIDIDLVIIDDINCFSIDLEDLRPHASANNYMIITGIQTREMSVPVGAKSKESVFWDGILQLAKTKASKGTITITKNRHGESGKKITVEYKNYNIYEIN